MCPASWATAGCETAGLQEWGLPQPQSMGGVSWGRHGVSAVFGVSKKLRVLGQAVTRDLIPHMSPGLCCGLNPQLCVYSCMYTHMCTYAGTVSNCTRTGRLLFGKRWAMVGRLQEVRGSAQESNRLHHVQTSCPWWVCTRAPQEAQGSAPTHHHETASQVCKESTALSSAPGLSHTGGEVAKPGAHTSAWG